MVVAGSRLRLSSSAPTLLGLALASLAPACGDDEGETAATTTTSTTPPTSSTTDDPDGSTTATPTTDAATTTTTDPSTTAVDDTAASTTGLTGDPTYPPPDAGTCPNGTVPVMLPGVSICAPFCASADDPCPMAATGDAPAQCIPFAGMGGSGDPCDDVTPCPRGEACDDDGTCFSVAFWACQLLCDAGQICPDDMSCSGIGTCGYP